jgi:hypothetical protein
MIFSSRKLNIYKYSPIIFIMKSNIMTIEYIEQFIPPSPSSPLNIYQGPYLQNICKLADPLN